MAFLEQRLDAKITQGATGGPSVPGRTKVYLPNGTLVQNFTADSMIHKLDISHGLRSVDDYQTVIDAFYVVMMTPYTGLRVRDWRDYKLTQANSAIISVGGSATAFQLCRAHKFGGQTYYRKILKPVSGTLTAFRTRLGSPPTVTVFSPIVDYTTGAMTITGHATGDTYAATGEFDIPMTFSDDEWVGSYEVSTRNLFIMSSDVKLEELMKP